MRHRFRLALACAPLALVAAAACPAAAKPCPNIMLVLDQSKSMEQDVDGVTPPVSGPSKWDLMRDTVTDLIKTWGDRVPFGLELYSSNSFRNDAQCYADTVITVPLGHGAASEIMQKLAAAQPFAETNTGEAIKRAAGESSLKDTAKSNIILLVTDGNPTCNSEDKTSMSAAYTVREISNAFRQSPSIKTFVVGFDGAGVDPLNLDRMASAGGAKVPGCGGTTVGTPCYYRAGKSAQELKDVLEKIITEAGGGEFGGALCDDSCYTIPCPAGQVCTTTELDPAPHCENDPCMGRSCGGGEFCRLGQCVRACSGGCEDRQTCSDGRCVTDLCGAKRCNAGQVCDPTSGACIVSPCPQCTDGNRCELGTGRCVTDQCRIITCPKGTTCVNGGNCVASGGGCEAGRYTGASAPATTLAVLLVGALLVLRRRRAR